MRKKILVIDDSRTARRMVRTALAETDYDLIEGEDGTDALLKLAEHPDAALVLCDVNMPVMSGIAMLTELAKEARPRPPIVMLTTEAQLSLVQEAKAAGAKGWIVKPFKPHLLLAAVRRLVGDE